MVPCKGPFDQPPYVEVCSRFLRQAVAQMNGLAQGGVPPGTPQELRKCAIVSSCPTEACGAQLLFQIKGRVYLQRSVVAKRTDFSQHVFLAILGSRRLRTARWPAPASQAQSCCRLLRPWRGRTLPLRRIWRWTASSTRTSPGARWRPACHKIP